MRNFKEELKFLKKEEELERWREATSVIVVSRCH